MFLPALAGAIAPYLTLWCSRSRRVRAGARRLAATGWPRRAGVAASALALLGFGVGSVPAWWPIAAAVGWWAFAAVDTFVAADRMRRYPDDAALHFDLDRPTTWPATAALIVTTWTWLLRARHRLAWAGWLAGALAWLLAGPPPLAVALAAHGAVMAGACLPVPAPGQGRARERLAPRLDGSGGDPPEGG